MNPESHPTKRLRKNSPKTRAFKIRRRSNLLSQTVPETISPETISPEAISPEAIAPEALAADALVEASDSAPVAVPQGTRRGRLHTPRPCQRTLIVGTCGTARRLSEELKRHFPNDFLLVGFVSDGSGEECEHLLDRPVLGTREELSILVRHHRIDRVMFSNCVDWQLENTGFTVRSPQDRRAGQGDAPGRSGRVIRERRREVSDLFEWASSSAFIAPGARRARFYEGAKRVFDVAFSVVALALSAPLALVVLPLVKWTSPGPVFYAQERVGRGGAPFTIFKIRTMRVDAETGSGPMLSPHGDTRSTRVGRILRATKIDEMPQFWNVLKGEMSIVGPRPERPHFVDPFSSHIYSYALRHSVRPGLTGLAQIKGDHLTHVYIKLHYDLIYVCHRNLALDAMLLWQTPITILRNILGR